MNRQIRHSHFPRKDGYSGPRSRNLILGVSMAVAGFGLSLVGVAGGSGANAHDGSDGGSKTVG